MAEIGTDLAGTTDITANLAEVSGITALNHALFRRMTTPKGSLFYDRNYGEDVRQWISASDPGPGVIERAHEVECLQDERVESASVSVERLENGKRLRMRITGESSEGDFALTILADALTVQLLKENQ